jgi:hypothetical protein
LSEVRQHKLFFDGVFDLGIEGFKLDVTCFFSILVFRIAFVIGLSIFVVGLLGALGS